MKSRKDTPRAPLPHSREQFTGTAAMAGTFIFWGLMPLYWHTIASVSPLEILGHRIVWSVFLLVPILFLQKRWPEIQACMRHKHTMLLLTGSSITIGCNWLLYIWAVNSGHLLEASLGYFINPLVNALFGYLFLKERLRLFQKIALGFALAGVGWKIALYGSLPGVALGVATTFALYGLLRKKTEVNPLPGLCIETSILFVPALVFLVFLGVSGELAFVKPPLTRSFLLAGCGAVTSLPLITFAYGAKRIQLTTVGLLQYLSPTLSFLLGLFFFGETLQPGDPVVFGLIWIALVLYTLEALGYNRKGSAPLKKEQSRES